MIMFAGVKCQTRVPEERANSQESFENLKKPRIKGKIISVQKHLIFYST